MEMDAGKTKIQKLFGGHTHNASQTNKDRISRLPEEILVHILSFLPTKEAVKTSILSKRWKYLWLSIPNFIFSDASWHDQADHLQLRPSFLDSIERALVHRNAAQCLGNVLLSLRTDVSASRLSSWLSAVVQHQVRKLDFSLPERKEFVLPTSLFTSKSLTSFRLQLHSVFKVPSFICFSSLKRLDLQGVVFQDDQSTHHLFSGCPVLEDLSLDDCHLENLTEITVSIPTLKSFTFFESHFFEDHYLGCKIIISAINLERIEVSGYLTVDVLPGDLPFLNSATIDISKWNGGVDLSLRIVQLLSGVHNVKELVLSRETLEHLCYDEDITALLPTFYNLTSLCGFYVFPMYNEYASRGLVCIVENSPKLEALCLPRGFFPGDECAMLETVPECFLSCLKHFHISDFSGCAEDVSLLKHVYKNAPFLKQLSMDCSPELSADFQKQEEILRQLQQVREGSGSCSVKFLPYVEWYKASSSILKSI